jgi:tetratricopeptide (TPR) repeat protein
MKKIITFSILAFVSMSGFTQKKGTTTNTVASKPEVSSYDVQYKVYRNAVNYDDFITARVAVHNMIALKPEMKEMKDTLAMLYYNSGSYVQSTVMAREIIKENPNNALILQILATSEENLGLSKEALANYESLYKLNQEVYFLYKIAVLQYTLKRFGECSASLNKLLTQPLSDKDVIQINYDQRNAQEVPLKAAAFNIFGMMAFEMGKLEEAQQYFSESQKAFPDFLLAQNNLQMTKEEMAKAKKEGTNGKK